MPFTKEELEVLAEALGLVITRCMDAKMGLLTRQSTEADDVKLKMARSLRVDIEAELAAI